MAIHKPRKNTSSTSSQDAKGKADSDSHRGKGKALYKNSGKKKKVYRRIISHSPYEGRGSNIICDGTYR